MKTFSALPTAFLVVYATYPMGWFLQTVALTIACTVQYTFIDYLVKCRNFHQRIAAAKNFSGLRKADEMG